MSLPALEPTFEATLGQVVVATALLFLLDRLLPVVPRSSDRDATGGGTSPWLRRMAILAWGGTIGGVLLFGFALLLPSLGLDQRVRDVRSGRPLVYRYSDPAFLAPLLAEPRADRVTVRWVGSNPPPLFDGRRERAEVSLTYFGSSNGTSVFFAPGPAAGGYGGHVYRWPTAAVEIVGTDPGGVPS